MTQTRRNEDIRGELVAEEHLLPQTYDYPGGLLEKSLKLRARTQITYGLLIIR